MIARSLKIVVVLAVIVRITVFAWEALHPLVFNSTFQNFDDFTGFYLPQLKWLAEGYLPYRDFAYSNTPLFLYLLYPFYALAPKVTAVPIVVTDALTAPVIYLIVRRNASERIAIAASLGYAFSPFAIVYEGISWLSEQPMLFLMLISVYFLGEDRVKTSAVFLGLAIMIKQDAVFVLPAFIFWWIKRHGLRASLKPITALLLVALAISAPFLILAPHEYPQTITFRMIDGLLPSYIPAPLQFSLPSSGGALIGFTSTSVTGVIPILTCTVLTNNFFGLSQICIGAISGLTVTNYAFTSVPPLFQHLLQATVLILLFPLLLELAIIPKKSRFVFSMAVSNAFLIIPILAFSDLPDNKYYLDPLYALLLASSTDAIGLGIAVVFPIIALANPSGLFFELIPVLEMQFLVVNLILQKRRARTNASSILGSGGSSPQETIPIIPVASGRKSTSE